MFKSGSGTGGVTAFSDETIGAGGTIGSAQSGIQYRPVSGDGGAVTTANEPFGTSINWEDGTVIVLRGTDATNTVTINHNDTTDGPILNGNATLGLNDVLRLIYDAGTERWIEQGRNF